MMGLVFSAVALYRRIEKRSKEAFTSLYMSVVRLPPLALVIIKNLHLAKNLNDIIATNNLGGKKKEEKLTQS